MDSFKIIFIFVIINILASSAQLSLQDKLNFLPRLRRANDQIKFPTIFNKNMDNVFKDIMKEDSEHASRRNFVSEEAADPPVYVLRRSNDGPDNLNPNKFYKVDLRRMYNFHAGMSSPIISAPSMANQLPEAEPILPGHTLLRPALGMLKSAVKFPHKDVGGGAGVYGNLDNLGMTYGGTGERVLYTGFRRNNNNFNDQHQNPTLLVALLRQGPEREEKPTLRYIDYAKKERERKEWQKQEKQYWEKQYWEKEKQRREQEKLGLAPKRSYYDHSLTDDHKLHSLTDDHKLKEVKRLLKRLDANGLTLEFFDIPRLKLEAMEEENYHDSIKPYTEFIEASRSKDFTMVQKRFPKIAKQYARNIPQQNRYNGYALGIKSYA